MLAVFAIHPHHHRYSPPITVTATCYAQTGTTASGLWTEPGMVASNLYPLGTILRFDHPVFGRRFYRVEDRIGWGTSLDFYNPSESACINFGRQTETYRVLLN